jgi:hypothetical protein
MSLTKLSIGENYLCMKSLFPPRESLVSEIPAGDGNIEKLFLYGALAWWLSKMISLKQAKKIISYSNFFKSNADR